MRERFDQYAANLKEASRLVKRMVPPGMSDEEILAAVHSDAEKLRALCKEDNALLEELVFSRTPESLSPAQAQELSAQAERLFHYPKSVDIGIAFRIHQLLYGYARLHGDRDGIIRELYHLGVNGFYLNLKVTDMGINVYRDEVTAFFSQAAAYLDQWDEITSDETHGYIIRCMANRNLPLPRDLDENGLGDGLPPEEIYTRYMRNFEETMRVVQSPVYRGKSPSLPWAGFAYSMHYDRLSFLSFLRKRHSPRIERDLMESAEYVYQYREAEAAKKGQGVTDARTIYLYAAARFHAGQISARELMDTLVPVYRQADPADFSWRGIQLNIMYPEYLATYAACLPPEQKPLYEPLLVQAQHELYQYLLHMPRNEYINQRARAMRDVVRSVREQGAYVRTRLLDSILTCHAPTYIHSVMVAWLNRQITAQLLEENPAALEGVFGFHGVSELRANRGKICSRAYLCGLYHDLGKSMVINYIGIYGRRLLDEEFNCIKFHSQMGYSLLKVFPDLQDVSEVALHHHRTYDGKGGYPRTAPPCSDAVREIAYITTVSDSIDAATDNVGRSYAVAKSYDTLVEELFQRSGSNYAPEIVRLFENQAFRERLGRDLAVQRRSLYCKVYRKLAEHP